MLKRLWEGPFLVLVVSLLLMSGCSGQLPEPPEEEIHEEQEVEEETPEEPEEVPEAPQGDQAREQLPEKIETTILIEGMEEDMTILLFRHTDVPFYTYYPDDMLFEALIDEREKSVRFFANFGGTIEENAYVEITVFSQKAINSESDFTSYIAGESGLLENRNVEWVEKSSETERVFPWTIMEYDYLNDEIVGTLYLGFHEGDYFYIDVHYPWEYGDGMAGRAHVIMKEFVWTEQRRRLMQ